MTSMTHDPAVDPRILSEEETRQIIDRVRSFVTGGGTSTVEVGSWWSGELRWARNRVSLTSDRRNISVTIQRVVGHSVGSASTNQLDDVSLESMVRAAERSARLKTVASMEDFKLPEPKLPKVSPLIWSDATFNATAKMRGGLATTLAQNAEAKGMQSAGFMRMAGATSALSMRQSHDEADVGREVGGARTSFRYNRYTVGECSMTVRHPQGIGSGWAGLSGYDWSAIDGARLADRALQKCLASLNPVAVEPGRFTVILEPQAVYDFIQPLMLSTSRQAAEAGQGPFVDHFDRTLRLYRTKLGMKVMDDRVTISHDPNDPLLGIVPRDEGLGPITWFDHGILKTLTNDRLNHSLPLLNEDLPSVRRNSFRMSGGAATVDDMIASTERGLVVTRFANVRMLDGNSVLCTGLSRDGIWLVEKGKISKPVKNMRFRESPLFTLNNLLELGTPVPVFASDRSEPFSAIVPPIKAQDFSFTSLADAV